MNAQALGNLDYLLIAGLVGSDIIIHKADGKIPKMLIRALVVVVLFRNYLLTEGTEQSFVERNNQKTTNNDYASYMTNYSDMYEGNFRGNNSTDFYTQHVKPYVKSSTKIAMEEKLAAVAAIFFNGYRIYKDIPAIGGEQ